MFPLPNFCTLMGFIEKSANSLPILFSKCMFTIKEQTLHENIAKLVLNLFLFVFKYVHYYLPSKYGTKYRKKNKRVNNKFDWFQVINCIRAVLWDILTDVTKKC